MTRIVTNFSALNGVTPAPNSYYSVTGFSNRSIGITTINGSTTASYSATATGFSATSQFSGQILTSQNNGLIIINNQQYQVFGASADGRTLFFGPDSGNQNPAYALSSTQAPPPANTAYTSVAPYTSPACFAAGTMILTTDGERAVEDLVVGDLIVTAGGQHRPIIWLGSRVIRPASWGQRDIVDPVRIGRGALGADLRPATCSCRPATGSTCTATCSARSISSTARRSPSSRSTRSPTTMSRSKATMR
ncbi:Hint domain-containing protein [Sphingomonas prati]|uniref:Hedgehog/Intein (Hint) domain-containing protein n=1 Tax=Sphingomonas prati TaxID=1843237 RepID=A0A7W9F4Q4_9SPHN|nr:Hint domain-containing protein [Sphingomonas prati]MBB5730700.1 hypothetical protein [Sphingomonas prati]